MSTNEEFTVPSTMGKQLSNPVSTGGGGARFESQVQALFLCLMLARGCVPCLPCWSITKIELQAKNRGYETDDIVVTVEQGGEQRKLIGQIKRSITVTKSDRQFGEVMRTAWQDFNNPKVFAKGKDIIALLTGPLSAADAHNVSWLLDQARHTASSDEFWLNVRRVNFSPPKSAEKAEVFQHHLKAANGGQEVARDKLHEFLRHFQLLSYDLDREAGGVLSLLLSHVAQFQPQKPEHVWARMVEVVATWNQGAGTITRDNLPEDLLTDFAQVAKPMPEKLRATVQGHYILKFSGSLNRGMQDTLPRAFKSSLLCGWQYLWRLWGYLNPLVDRVASSDTAASPGDPAPGSIGKGKAIFSKCVWPWTATHETAEETTGGHEAPEQNAKTNWAQHPDATCLALLLLIGAWNENSEGDQQAIAGFLEMGYAEWEDKALGILHCNDSPLTRQRGGLWQIVDQTERRKLWGTLKMCITDQRLKKFKSLAVSVLKEPNHALDLSAENQHAASIHGGQSSYSSALRRGIAEGLAILGNHSAAASNFLPLKAKDLCASTLHEVLSDADWLRWHSLDQDRVLPVLAEAAPGKFLDIVEDVLRQTPCPFYHESNLGYPFGLIRNYLPGLFWALEGLAWAEQYFVRACVVLGQLAHAHPDSDGKYGSSPSRSLVTILLPWFPQTLAPFAKQKLAVETLFKEQPEVAWNLVMQLLPNQRGSSAGSHKPVWLEVSPDHKKEVTEQEYWQQVSAYAELAVTAAGHDTGRLAVLIDQFANLPDPAFGQLIQKLSSTAILELDEEQRLLLWDHLTKFTIEQRRTGWAMPEKSIASIEQVAEQLAPTKPFFRHQPLFNNCDYELYEDLDSVEEQDNKLDLRRDKAVAEIFQQKGIEGVIRFAESVTSPRQVGSALGAIGCDDIEQTLLPGHLETTSDKHKDLVRGFIWRRHNLKGWVWCDKLDRSRWTPKQMGRFLMGLPFTQDTWTRAAEWLRKDEGEYWSHHTHFNAYQTAGALNVAVEKLLQYNRPGAALYCLSTMHHTKRPVDAGQCVRALLAAHSSSDPYPTNRCKYDTVQLVKFLQSEPSVNQDELAEVEWAYLSWLGPYSAGFHSTTPKRLEHKLASDPKFFAEVIQLTYRPENEDSSTEGVSEEQKTRATNVWGLLRDWKTPPGVQASEPFDEEHFTKWLQRVVELCTEESGHLEVALMHVGTVLFHAPPDPDGLWIHRAVAKALNKPEYDDLRQGFRSGAYNSRGVHTVDPTGGVEKALARKYRDKAAQVENAGFLRFARTLGELASSYDREAEHTITMFAPATNQQPSTK